MTVDDCLGRMDSGKCKKMHIMELYVVLEINIVQYIIIHWNIICSILRCREVNRFIMNKIFSLFIKENGIRKEYTTKERNKSDTKKRRKTALGTDRVADI